MQVVQAEVHGSAMKYQQPNLLVLRTTTKLATNKVATNKRTASKQALAPGHQERIGTEDPR